MIAPDYDSVGPTVVGGPTRAELLRGAVRSAIIRGELRPGQAISLDALADRHKLRLPAVTANLSTLESELLLTVRADRAVVAPLSRSELAASHRLGMAMAESLLPRALCSLTPPDLDRIDRLLPSDAADLADYAVGGIRRCARALGALFWPTCTGPIRRELHGLLDHGRRYCFFAGEVLGSLRVPSMLEYAAEFRGVLTLLRRGQVTLAVSRELELVRHLHMFARLSLEYPRLADDDMPMAEVIPPRSRVQNRYLMRSRVLAQRSGPRPA